jgi:hypothetical protein
LAVPTADRADLALTTTTLPLDRVFLEKNIRC